jgi:HSP20 family molecular chaperone IbpA
VVHFYRPDEDLKNVDVKLENGQLRLTASQKQSSGDEKSGTTRTEIGRYEEAVTLPRPVQAKGMKVERKDGTIVVTLPKA